MQPRETQVIHQLFLLNLVLQLFDGVASYYGLRGPGHEANPLIASVMEQIGIGMALLLFKSGACAALVLLRAIAWQPVIPRLLTIVAVMYGCLSFIPWTARNLLLL